MKKIVFGETIVKIDWEDAWSNTDYWTIAEIKDRPTYDMILVGIVIRNDKTGITVARERLPNLSDGEMRFRDIQHIPRAMIRKVKILG